MDISELEYLVGELDNSEISHYSDIESISDYVLKSARNIAKNDNLDELDKEIKLDKLNDLVMLEFDKLEEPDNDDNSDMWDEYDKRLDRVQKLDSDLNKIYQTIYK